MIYYTYVPKIVRLNLKSLNFMEDFMKIDWNKKYTTISVYAFLVICASIIFFSIIGEIDAFTTKLGWVVSTLQPFIIGFVMAYLFNFILVFSKEKI